MALCPVCGHEGEPTVSQQMSSTGWIVFVLLLVFTCVLAFIPFLVDGCKETVYKCANCHAKIGTA